MMNTEINNPFASLDNRLKSIESKLDAITSGNNPKIEKRFYAVNEAAEKLGVASITLYRGIDAGTIPHKRIGSRVMIPGSYIEK